MQKPEDAAILMKKSDMIYLFGAENLQKLPMQPFDPRVCEFLDALSKKIRKDEEANLYSDILTFAFWIRRSNLMKMKEAYREELRVGKGIVFHIAPSNVPINFAYTFVFGLLSGNANVVNASSKDFLISA